MTTTRRTIRSILVPTDFSDAADIAFVHALRLAIALKAELEIFHVEPRNDTADWHWAPSVINTLVRWGFLPSGAGPADVSALGIRARHAMATGSSPEHAIRAELAASHADLVVVATHGRSGLARWLQPSVAMPVAVRGAVPVLVIPQGAKGFVDAETGYAALSRVLVPVDHVPHPAPGFDAATLLTMALPGPSVELATIHVGGGTPDLVWMRPAPGWALHHWSAEGDVLENLQEVIREWGPDVVVAVSEGRRNFLDVLRGSTVERLLDRSPRPVLVVPAEWGLA